MTPVDWDDLEHWGGNIHVGTTTDDAHTASEKRAEDSRG